MRNFILLLTLFLMSSFCVNTYYYYENADGEGVDTPDGLIEIPVFYQSFNRPFYEKMISEIDENKDGRFDNNKKAQSDKAAALMKLGKTQEALSILQNLYYNDPNPDYNIVANLGTAYELAGQVDSALILINQALELNQDSHRGSEWFHVKVLEAKQKIKNNPNWLKTNKLLNINADTVFAKKSGEYEYSEDEGNITYAFHKMHHNIVYQLKERVPFTPKPNQLLANILNEYGDLLTEVSIDMAYIIYSIGTTYDAENWYGMEKKAGKMLNLIAQSDGVDLPDLKKYMPAPDVYKPVSTPHKHQHSDEETIDRNNLLTSTLATFLAAIIVIGGVLYGAYRFRRWIKTREVFEE